MTAGALDHLVLSPATATIAAGGSQAYTAEGFDAANNSLGDVTSTTTFTITPNGSCTAASCTATTVGAHTVTGTNGAATGTATLTVTAGALDHLVLSPATATIAAGGSQAYTAEGFDAANNSLGDVTATTTFTITPNGTCTGASCTASDCRRPHGHRDQRRGDRDGDPDGDGRRARPPGPEPGDGDDRGRWIAGLHGGRLRRGQQQPGRRDGDDDVHDHAQRLVHGGELHRDDCRCAHGNRAPRARRPERPR